MIAVCGEAVVDLLAADPAVPQTFVACPGGGPANTAVALARLGAPVTMAARLSRDGFGRQLRAHLESNGVDLRDAVDVSEPSSVALVTTDAQGEPSYRFLLDGAADFGWTSDDLPVLRDDVVALHTGSLALVAVPALEELLRTARPRMTVSIDPNLRAGLLPPEPQAAVARWLRLADVVKLSVDDIALTVPDADPLEVAAGWSREGGPLIVLTAGADGAAAFVDGQMLRRAAPRVPVADTVGAGDAFTAGLLHHLHRAGSLGGRLDRLTLAAVAPALDYAATVAALTCTRAGADPPTADEVAQRLRTRSR